MHGYRIAARAASFHGFLVASGITAMVGIYALINVSVSTGLMPTTGLPLPFVSYGGSSLLLNLSGIGILAAVAREKASAASSTAWRLRGELSRPHPPSSDGPLGSTPDTGGEPMKARRLRDRGVPSASAPLGTGVRRVHMVGIGGAGMEALARLLVDLGLPGHRLGRGRWSRGRRTAADGDPRLRRPRRGPGRRAPTSSCTRRRWVWTTASAGPRRGMGIEQWPRARALGAVSRTCDTVAVAGTHGKTTTASLIAGALRCAGQEPRVAIGGWMGGRPQPTAPSGDLLVVEADEYRRAFHELEPWISVVTNIEMEHVDCYDDRDDLVEAFGIFVARRRSGGGVAVNGDDELCRAAAARSQADAVTYGFGPSCEVRAEAPAPTGTGSAFAVHLAGERRPVDLGVPGGTMSATPWRPSPRPT